MYTRSISDLSTTLLSNKESNLTSYFSEKIPDIKNIEISASINSFHQEEDSSKIFHKNYILYDIKLITRYKPWSISRRYSEFFVLNEKLKSLNIKNLPELPPKYLIHNDEKLLERQAALQDFLNAIFKNVNILNYKVILDFINCPNDVIDIFQKNIEHLNLNNLKDESNINYYSSLVQFQLNYLKSKLIDNNNDYYREADVSPGNLVIKEFLRNLMDNSRNKSELINQFEYFIKTEKNICSFNNNINTSKGNNWYSFLTDEINIFFNGFDSNVSNEHINGFLYHCGNIHNNEVGAKRCIEFLSKILSEYYNPQAELFIKIFRKTKLENIIQMELENHIIKNKNSARLNAFEVLKKFVGDGRKIYQKIHRILECPKAEELFINWHMTLGDKEIE